MLFFFIIETLFDGNDFIYLFTFFGCSFVVSYAYAYNFLSYCDGLLEYLNLILN